MKGRLKFWLPAGVFVALTVVLAVGLTLDPKKVPSLLIDEPAPVFELANLWEPDTRLSPADMPGMIRYEHIGPVDLAALTGILIPEIESLVDES